MITPKARDYSLWRTLGLQYESSTVTWKLGHGTESRSRTLKSSIYGILNTSMVFVKECMESPCCYLGKTKRLENHFGKLKKWSDFKVKVISRSWPNLSEMLGKSFWQTFQIWPSMPRSSSFQGHYRNFLKCSESHFSKKSLFS